MNPSQDLCNRAIPARRRNALTIRYHRMEAFDAWESAAIIA